MKRILIFALLLNQGVVFGQSDLDYDSLKHLAERWLGERIDSAFFYSSQMLAKAEELDNPSKMVESMIFQGLSYGYLNEFIEEEKYYRKALYYSTKHVDSLGMGKALLNLGVSQFYQGRLDSAAYFYERALSVLEPIGNNRFTAMSLNNLGQVYSRLSQFEEAKNAYERSLEYKILANDTSGITNTYFNLASLCLSTNDYEQALHYSRETVRFTEILGDSTEIGGAYINMVLALTNLDSLNEAQDFISKALRYQDAFKSEEAFMDLHAASADLYYKLGAPDKTKYHLQKMSEFIREDAFHEAQMKYYELSYQMAKQDSNTKAALLFLEKYLTIKDLYVSERVQKNVANLEKKYQTEQKERQITQLELDKKNASLALANSQNQRNAFIFGFVIIFILASFTYYRYTTKKRNSDLLTQKNAQITEALEAREILLKEIHHRVKNNLQVISSLLKLQAGSLQDVAAQDAIKEGQHRVKSMALIHQKLYNAEDIRGVDIQDYFENLILELKRVFGVDDIKTKVDTSGLKMDIDTVIPLGLIMNELITNALKYAFTNTRDASLELSVKEVGDKVIVVLSDNGIGMDETAMQQHNSFGWRMIRSLSRKVKAEIEVLNNQGTIVTLSLARYKLVV